MSFIKIPVKGMNDFLPSEIRLREYVINQIKETYQQFGFNIIELLLALNILKIFVQNKVVKMKN